MPLKPYKPLTENNSSGKSSNVVSKNKGLSLMEKVEKSGNNKKALLESLDFKEFTSLHESKQISLFEGAVSTKGVHRTAEFLKKMLNKPVRTLQVNDDGSKEWKIVKMPNLQWTYNGSDWYAEKSIQSVDLATPPKKYKKQLDDAGIGVELTSPDVELFDKGKGKGVPSQLQVKQNVPLYGISYNSSSGAHSIRMDFTAKTGGEVFGIKFSTAGSTKSIYISFLGREYREVAPLIAIIIYAKSFGRGLSALKKAAEGNQINGAGVSKIDNKRTEIVMTPGMKKAQKTLNNVLVAKKTLEAAQKELSHAVETVALKSFDKPLLIVYGPGGIGKSFTTEQTLDDIAAGSYHISHNLVTVNQLLAVLYKHKDGIVVFDDNLTKVLNGTTEDKQTFASILKNMAQDDQPNRYIGTESKRKTNPDEPDAYVGGSFLFTGSMIILTNKNVLDKVFTDDDKSAVLGRTVVVDFDVSEDSIIDMLSTIYQQVKVIGPGGNRLFFSDEEMLEMFNFFVKNAKAGNFKSQREYGSGLSMRLYKSVMKAFAISGLEFGPAFEKEALNR